MKASEFKKLIKEAVREVIREELMEVVQQPTVQESTPPPPPPIKRTGNTIADMLAETAASMTSTDYQNVIGADSSMAQNFNRNTFLPRQSFKPASDEPAIIAQTVASAPKVGLDLSQLGFINKAAAIVNAADKKQKEKHGV